MEREDRYRREQAEREEKRENERECRQELLLTTLKEAQPAVPQKVSIQNLNLPSMKEGDDLVEFITIWKLHLKDQKFLRMSGQGKPKIE